MGRRAYVRPTLLRLLFRMHLTAPAALHPASSLLGRFVRRWSADTRQAESRYIVAAVLLLGTAALIGQWAWVIWGGEGADALAYFAAQAIGGVAVCTFCLLGWRRPIHVHADREGLVVQRGVEGVTLAFDAIQSTKRISTDAYYRHWRRYAATRSFVNRPEDELLLLTTDHGPVVLGLPTDAFQKLEAHLAACVTAGEARHLVRAA